MLPRARHCIRFKWPPGSCLIRHRLFTGDVGHPSRATRDLPQMQAIRFQRRRKAGSCEWWATAVPMARLFRYRASRRGCRNYHGHAAPRWCTLRRDAILAKYPNWPTYCGGPTLSSLGKQGLGAPTLVRRAQPCLFPGPIRASALAAFRTRALRSVECVRG